MTPFHRNTSSTALRTMHAHVEITFTATWPRTSRLHARESMAVFHARTCSRIVSTDLTCVDHPTIQHFSKVVHVHMWAIIFSSESNFCIFLLFAITHLKQLEGHIEVSRARLGGGDECPSSFVATSHDLHRSHESQPEMSTIVIYGRKLKSVCNGR